MVDHGPAVERWCRLPIETERSQFFHRRYPTGDIQGSPSQESLVRDERHRLKAIVSEFCEHKPIDCRQCLCGLARKRHRHLRPRRCCCIGMPLCPKLILSLIGDATCYPIPGGDRRVLAIEECLPARVVWLPMASEHTKWLARGCYRNEQLTELMNPPVTPEKPIHLEAMRLAVGVKLDQRVGMCSRLLNDASGWIHQFVDLPVR